MRHSIGCRRRESDAARMAWGRPYSPLRPLRRAWAEAVSGRYGLAQAIIWPGSGHYMAWLRPLYGLAQAAIWPGSGAPECRVACVSRLREHGGVQAAPHKAAHTGPHSLAAQASRHGARVGASRSRACRSRGPGDRRARRAGWGDVRRYRDGDWGVLGAGSDGRATQL